MKNTFKLTVGDILTRPHFQNAKVVAGKNGLNGLIRWVHIMEVTEIGHLINGNELILTTGLGWRENGEASLSLLQQLIDKKAAGICVELGTYIPSIPNNMIELANKHNFPIIVFTEQVRFIDITQELNGLFIEAHYKTMINLESVSNQFNRLLLSTDGFKRILRLLHQFLNVQVAYAPAEGQVQFYPPVEKSQEKELEKLANRAQPQNVINSPAKSASKPIQALGHKFADLIILSKGQDLTDFDYLVLDRAATALSQDQLRLLYVEEKRKHHENRWLLEWLKGEHGKENVEQYIASIEPSMKPNGCAVCICKIDLQEQDHDLTYFSMIFRTIFEQHGFFSLVSFERNNLVFALINKRNQQDWRNRLSDALAQIRKTDLMKKQVSEKTTFGIGKLSELDQLHKSYEMAMETIYIQKKTGDTTVSFYEDLYVYRLISQLNKEKSLEVFIEDYIGAILKYDQTKNSQMLETLKVFLEVNGSKKDAAERLFIVRQTLYHRIEKLKELLGDDFMRSDKRLAIEFAVYAHDFLKKPSLT
ncbi:purine catabolism regulator [Salirhabdus euzebyi]|uniref:Purine catabolism regulator n=1 Tax=Salirhabdus euzebyi TaxID=394506 RepID=A0A841Q7Y8_9BACI|nr:PucR family transcriptional regulator [Salirhabdus euzebyi]MBB6454709.1 purine catabolism regulator [Salirhabdus euzebyi]